MPQHLSDLSIIKISRSWPGYLFLFLLLSCEKKPEEKDEIMIAKTIPLIYKESVDTFFQQHGDTLYYQGSFFTGYRYALYPNGDTSFVEGYFNGSAEGQQRKFFPGHQKQEERGYINGKKEGVHRSWWPDGKIKMDYVAHLDDYEGEFREWNSAGTLIKKFHYSRGREAGRQQLWWDNGKLRANYEVRNGRTFGLIGSKLCMNPNDSIN